MIIRPRVYPRSHDHCVSQQEPRLRPTRTVSSTHAPGPCPHMDTRQRDREITSYRLNKDTVTCPHMDTRQRNREITSYRLNKDTVTCPHVDTRQRDRELQEYTGLAVLGVLG